MGSERGASSSGHHSQKSQAGPYELLSILGQGASGTVYLARRPGIERMFALKLLAENLDPEGRARVQREAQVASRLDHPGIVRVVDFGVLGRQLYIVMEHVPGPTLRDLLAQGSLPPDRAADIVAQIGLAMDTAHAAGVVHRDLKPANVILDARDNKPKVTDFGLARDTRASYQLTRPGEVIGTPYYMAAEQIHGGNVDARTDVYAMGVMLYELLTGARPFEGKTVAAVVHGILNATPTPPKKLNPSVPPALQAACLKAISRKPDQRYSTAQAFARELSSPDTLSATSPARVTAVAAAALGGLSAALLVLAAWAVIAFNAGNRYSLALRAAADQERAKTSELAEARDARKAAERASRPPPTQRPLRPPPAPTPPGPNVARIADEIKRAAMEPTGHLAQVVDGLIVDLEDIDGTDALKANLLYNRARFAEANDVYEQARSRGDADPELAVIGFRANSRLGDRAKAQEALQWVAEAHPQSLPAQFARLITGVDQITIGQLAALRSHEDLKFNYFHNLSIMTLMSSNRFQMALEVARAAVEFDPCNADGYLYLVSCQIRLWDAPNVRPSAQELADCMHAYRVAAELSQRANAELQQLKGVLDTLVDRHAQGR